MCADNCLEKLIMKAYTTQYKQYLTEAYATASAVICEFFKLLYWTTYVAIAPLSLHSESKTIIIWTQLQ